MEYLGITYNGGCQPALDQDFIPMGAWMDAYEKGADHPIAIAVERNGGQITVYRTCIYATAEKRAADWRYVERCVKFLLWSVGGFRVYLQGCDEIARRLQTEYVYDEVDETVRGNRWFDVQFMSDVFERGFSIVSCHEADFPSERESACSVGYHTQGCRIGFDAGGSDRKVSAVIDGETVYSEEVVWSPKTHADPQYHFNEIVSAFRTAASHMPRVDGIGVSSAGVFIGNAPMVSSLFIAVPREKEVRRLVKTVYDRAAEAIGPDVPIVVANDGDVTALAGAMGMHVTAVMGLAMGTSEAVGYVDRSGKIKGWFNELAFAPVDLSEQASADGWSTDIGVGCQYFSQDAVIRLAVPAGIILPENLTPAEKLREVQILMEKKDPRAVRIFESIGCYLAHTLHLYSRFYDMDYVMVLGRVMSGTGGDTVLNVCRRVLLADYPALAKKLTVQLPDEKTRRVGQAVAAASLPETR